MKMTKKIPQQQGFTLVEMLVVAPIVILAIGAFLGAIIAMTGEVLASRAANTLTYNVQDALNRIEQDVKLSNRFLATNSVMGDNQGYNDDSTNFTNIEGASGTSLILSIVATTGNPVSADSSYVYLKDAPSDCATPQFNTPFTYNIVYYIKDDTLFRRTLMPLNYTDANIVCSTPWQQPSCSPAFMASPTGQAGTAFCKTEDIKLVSGVTASNFIISYFNGESTESANTTASTETNSTDRATALQSATTVRVSINAQQTASGRSVERAASLRVSRLDENASGIATITTDGAPSAPTISSSISDPTDVVLAWPKVATATGYTLEYRINGGGWTTAFTNQPTQTFTVTTTTHKDALDARVTAINASGSSGFGSTSATVPLWVPLSTQNGWVTYSPPYATPAYTKTSAGVIMLKGMIRSGSGTIANLPVGYRPSMYIMFTNSSSANVPGRLDIRDTGDIIMSVGSNAWFSLDGIAFMPASTSFNAPTFSNGWVNYSPSGGSTVWRDAGYMLDSAGRVQTTGLIRAGTVTTGTTIFNLPAAYRPAQYLHILNNSGNSGTHFSVDTSGNVLAKGGSNAHFSLQSMYYPSGRATGTDCSTQWCALPMQNGWKHYGGVYGTPQYTKSSDGIVMLKGLLNGGSSATAQIATLPAGFCPAERLLLPTISNSSWARLDITRNSNGTCNVLPLSGASTTWFALDDIHYIAEP